MQRAPGCYMRAEDAPHHSALAAAQRTADTLQPRLHRHSQHHLCTILTTSDHLRTAATPPRLHLHVAAAVAPFVGADVARGQHAV